MTSRPSQRKRIPEAKESFKISFNINEIVTKSVSNKNLLTLSLRSQRNFNF